MLNMVNELTSFVNLPILPVMAEDKKKRLNLYVPDDGEALIEQGKILAVKDKTSFNFIVWQALREYLDRAERKPKEKNLRDKLIEKKK